MFTDHCYTAIRDDKCGFLIVFASPTTSFILGKERAEQLAKELLAFAANVPATSEKSD